MADQKIIEEWLYAADQDFGFASSCLADIETTYFGFICFHFQQSAEKYLKAYVVAKKLKFAKIHDLDALRIYCLGTDLVFENIRDECIYLSDYYLETRYPPMIPSELSRSESKKAKEAAERIGQLVKNSLKL